MINITNYNITICTVNVTSPYLIKPCKWIVFALISHPPVVVKNCTILLQCKKRRKKLNKIYKHARQLIYLKLHIFIQWSVSIICFGVFKFIICSTKYEITIMFFKELIFFYILPLTVCSIIDAERKSGCLGFFSYCQELPQQAFIKCFGYLFVITFMLIST